MGQTSPSKGREGVAVRGHGGLWLVAACMVGPSALAAPAVPDQPGRGVAVDAAPPPALPALSARPGERRPRPVYDGRAAAPTSAGRALLWVPRVLLFPVHFALDAVVRRPLVRLVALAEKHYLVPWLRWLFFWRENRSGLFPTFFYELGLNPSAGLYFFHRDLFRAGHDLALHGAFWTDDWVALQLTDDWALQRHRTHLRIDARFERRPDRPYFGLGPMSFNSDRAYYRHQVVGAWGQVRRELKGLNRVSLRAGYRRVSFSAGQRPSVTSKFDVTAIPGFAGYGLLSGEAEIHIDSRSSEPELPDRGARLELVGSYNLDPEDTRRSFFRWGGTLAASCDLTGRHHIVGLEVFAAFVENLGAEPVPFEELVTMGGLDKMYGYSVGRFRGESALAFTANYRYPIWMYIDAELFLGLGNAFDGHLQAFGLQRMYLCWGVGFRSVLSRDVSFQALFGFGTNRLDSPSVDVSSFNAIVGVRSGS